MPYNFLMSKKFYVFTLLCNLALAIPLLKPLQAKEKTIFHSLKYNWNLTETNDYLQPPNYNKKNIGDLSKTVNALISVKDLKNKINNYICKPQHLKPTKKQLALSKKLQKRLQSTNVDAGHKTQILTNGKKSKYSIVLMHGLYMSPNQTRRLANAYKKLGFNVINLRLPGHKEKPYTNLKSVTWKDWDKKLKSTLKIAKQLGEKIIVSGHSTGGLLAHKAALDYAHAPNTHTAISGVLTFSPSLRVKTINRLGTSIGALFNLESNFNCTYMPAKTGTQAGALADYIQDKYSENHFYEEGIEGAMSVFEEQELMIKNIYQPLKKLNIPMLNIDSPSDRVVDTSYSKTTFEYLKKKNTLYLTEEDCFISTHMTTPSLIAPGFSIQKNPTPATCNKNIGKQKNSFINNLIKNRFKSEPPKILSKKCLKKYLKQKIQFLDFIDKNFPERCN